MRKKRVYKNRKLRKPDYKYGRLDVGRFINYLMKDGKKTIAEKILYQAFELVNKKLNQDPIKVFERAVENASPVYEVVSRRVGGANYQVPVRVRPDRKFFLAAHWIIDAARSKKGKPMFEKLAEEIILAYNNEGDAIRKKRDTHRMAEANRAFAHFA